MGHSVVTFSIQFDEAEVFSFLLRTNRQRSVRRMSGSFLPHCVFAEEMAHRGWRWVLMMMRVNRG